LLHCAVKVINYYCIKIQSLVFVTLVSLVPLALINVFEVKIL